MIGKRVVSSQAFSRRFFPSDSDDNSWLTTACHPARPFRGQIRLLRSIGLTEKPIDLLLKELQEPLAEKRRTGQRTVIVIPLRCSLPKKKLSHFTAEMTEWTEKVLVIVVAWQHNSFLLNHSIELLPRLVLPLLLQQWEKKPMCILDAVVQLAEAAITVEQCETSYWHPELD